MASVANVIEGLEVLSKTASVPRGLAEQGETDTPTAHLLGASHDIIYGPRADPSTEDQKRLDELGWHFDSEAECWSVFV